MTQQIRISQFVLTYGPGAIIESIEGPRVIPRADIGLFGGGRGLRPSDYEICEQRIKGVIKGARIYRLPSNAELGVPENRPIYFTKPFPTWKLCVKIHADKGRNFHVLYTGDKCPVCGSTGRKNWEAIRFVKACPKGHMDEVDWYYLAHGHSSVCQHSGWFRWYGGGGSISNIEVECPRCGSKKFSLGQVYRQSLSCTGRFPEREPLNSVPIRYSCDESAKIIQRQASNLRIPELLTLFSIPPRHTELHILLQKTPIYATLSVSEITSKITSKKQLERNLIELKNKNLVDENTVSKILQYPWDEISEAIKGVLVDIPSSYHELILEEFRALSLGSDEGIPPTRLPAPKSPVVIEMNPNLVRKVRGEKGTIFRIAPVSRLRTVTVQRGYRRAVGAQTSVECVEVSFPDLDSEEKWYPGVEFLGEGIFITIDSESGEGLVEGETANRWMDVFCDSSSYPAHLFRDSKVRVELHPRFVWWHTLSHLLIRAIAAEAGYSSAAIRERIYLEFSKEKARGGVLLYATQAGSEGTLGGLVALVTYFQDVLEMALEQLKTCSADPLCLGQKFRRGSYNGAACYGCLLLPETSCEHRNMWLDRNILLENLP